MATYNLLGFDSTNNLPILPSSADTANVQGDFTVAGDQIVTGNLTVNGTTTTINSEIVTADRSLLLNSDYTAAAVEDAYVIAVTDPDTPATPWTSSNYNIFIENQSSIKFQGSTAPTSDAQWPSAGDLVLIKGNPNAEDNGIYEVENASSFGGSAYIVIRNGASTGSPAADVAGFANTSLSNYGSSSSFLPAGFEIVPVKVVGMKTDSANDRLEVIYGTAGGSMSISALASSAGAALTDITAGTGNALLTTATGDITIEVDTAQALKMQINSADKLVIDDTDIKVKAGNNLLIESTASLAQQLTFVGGSAVAKKDLLYLNASGQAASADADAGGLAHNVIGVALEAGGASAATHQACTYPGQAVIMNFGSDLTSGDTGKPAYLSTTAGRATVTAPSTSGDQVVRVGYVIDGSSNVGSTGLHQVLFMPQFISTVS